MRKCNKCGTEYSIDNFPFRYGKYEGVRGRQCRNCLAAYARTTRAKWSAEKRAIKTAKSRKYYKDHRNEILVQVKEYQIKNKQIIYAQKAEYRKNNKPKLRETERRIRAKRRGAIGSHTNSEVENIFQMQKCKCAVCECQLTKYHIDHVIPLSRGGSDYKENIQILCADCNHTKYCKDPIEFMQSKGYLI